MPNATSAGPRDGYVWRNVEIGGGGFSPGIIFSPAEKGLVYLRTDIGGVYRWEAALRRWKPLQDDISDGNYFGIESVAPDPVDPNTVYVAAGMYRGDPAAILRSRDRGDHWQVFPVSFRMGGNEDGRGLGERLAVDPNDRSILYYGSRNDGLQRSTDHGETWSAVASFPVVGRGMPEKHAPAHAGIAFVVFDPSGGSTSGSKTIFAGVADPGPEHLFQSVDKGASWTPVQGQPRADLLPVQAKLEAGGILYIAYSNGIGPNGVTDGAVLKLDTHRNIWTDITPDKTLNHPHGGYMGLSIDGKRPGTLMVATMDRFIPGDTVWRSTDGGKTWRDLKPLSTRDVSRTPFLLWGKPEFAFGWWIAGLAIDPFDSSHVAYTTGATVYATDELEQADVGKPIKWKPWVDGVEETAVLMLTSPSQGPHLMSGIGDIGGGVHDDLARSPAVMFNGSFLPSTLTIDYAGVSPNVMVRSGEPPKTPKGQENALPTSLAFSTDFGQTWQSLIAPSFQLKAANGAITRRRFDDNSAAAIEPSADGGTLVVMTPVPVLTRDHGKSWSLTKGLPAGRSSNRRSCRPEALLCHRSGKTHRARKHRRVGDIFIPRYSWAATRHGNRMADLARRCVAPYGNSRQGRRSLAPRARPALSFGRRRRIVRRSP